MPENRTTITVADDSVLNRVANQRRSAYLRAVVDAHLEELRQGLSWLAPAYTSDQIVYLIQAADLPARETRGTDYALLKDPERAAVDSLAAECELAGWEPAELLKELQGSAHA